VAIFSMNIRYTNKRQIFESTRQHLVFPHGLGCDMAIRSLV